MHVGLFRFGRHVRIDIHRHTDFTEANRNIRSLAEQPVHIKVALNRNRHAANRELLLHCDNPTDASDAPGQRNKQIFQRGRPRIATAVRRRLIHGDNMPADIALDLKF